jgi:DNA-binding NarL/FixJ family response regulator
VQIGIVLVDDHPIFRQGLKSLLEREGFGISAEGADGLEAIRLAKEFQPDLVVLDLSMPGVNGLEAAREIQNVAPRTKVVLVTVHRQEQYVVEAIRAGIRGYIFKSEAAMRLPHAIREVYAGRRYFSPAVAEFAAGLESQEDASGNPGNQPVEKRPDVTV